MCQGTTQSRTQNPFTAALHILHISTSPPGCLPCCEVNLCVLKGNFLQKSIFRPSTHSWFLLMYCILWRSADLKARLLRAKGFQLCQVISIDGGLGNVLGRLWWCDDVERMYVGRRGFARAAVSQESHTWEVHWDFSHGQPALFMVFTAFTCLTSHIFGSLLRKCIDEQS